MSSAVKNSCINITCTRSFDKGKNLPTHLRKLLNRIACKQLSQGIVGINVNVVIDYLQRPTGK